MGVKEKRIKYKQEFRKEILEAARELFVSEGYEKFSMRKLAEKIDYSPTTIYLYFEDKDALLFEICEDFFEGFLAQLNRIRSGSQDPVENLRHALLHLMEFGLHNPDHYKVIFFTKRVYGTREEFLEKESTARKTYFAFRGIVQDCISAGQLRDADVDVVADTLAVASQGVAATALYSPDFLQDRSDVVVRTLVDTLLRGYQK